MRAGVAAIEDEGLDLLDGAMMHLKARAEADIHDQEVGDFEAYSILSSTHREIMGMYQCQQCGKALEHRGEFCSPLCKEAFDL